MFERQPPRSKTPASLGALLSLATLAFAPAGIAQQAQTAAQTAAAAAQADAAAPAGAAGPAGAAAQAEAELTDAQLERLERLTPVASYAVEDEITVIGVRPGDIRKRLWDIDREIESTIVDFFHMLNDIIVDEQFHVHCRMVARPSPFGPGTRSAIKERRCYSGFQLDELDAMNAYTEAGGLAQPNQQFLVSKEQQYHDLVMQAMASYPALVVAAENLLWLEEEREGLTGDAPALSFAQYERQRAREDQQAVLALADRRREREDQREAERAARRAARQTD